MLPLSPALQTDRYPRVFPLSLPCQYKLKMSYVVLFFHTSHTPFLPFPTFGYMWVIFPFQVEAALTVWWFQLWSTKSKTLSADRGKNSYGAINQVSGFFSFWRSISHKYTYWILWFIESFFCCALVIHLFQVRVHRFLSVRGLACVWWWKEALQSYGSHVLSHIAHQLSRVPCGNQV